jgi:ABC-2 type transport system permease protein
MSVMFTAIFSAASIVWDREFGFLREMLVAPVSRSAIVIGKCLGGATIATFQGIIMLALAGLADVPYDPVLMITLVGELLLLAVTLTAFGVMMAARITQFQAFMALTQMLVMPLFFLSGALYPLTGLPTWLSILTRLDPLTLCRRADAARCVQSPESQRGGAAGDVAGHHVGRLGGADTAVTGDRGGHGTDHDGCGHCHFQQARVVPLTGGSQ